MINDPALIPWISRIKKNLHFDGDVAPPASWLLVPVDGNELTDQEADELLKSLRVYLFHGRSRPDIPTIQRRIRRMTPDERLVLLYTLRYIALQGAGQNRYWPLCHTLLFEQKIDLTSLQTKLAPEFTDQWLAFYRGVQGRLFFPKHGKRNIKWPLAHAGLLVGDKELLNQFRNDLARVWQTAFHLLLEPDGMSDFGLELEEWLILKGHSHEPFCLTITDKERGLITLELAQHYLSSTQHSQPVADESPVWTALRRRTRTLVYNSDDQQIELHIKLHFATSQGDLSVQWQQQTRRCRMDATHTRYDIALPLAGSDWPTFVDFKSDRSTERVRLPKSIGAKPVVFAANTGQQVQTWRFGEEYCLLFPANQCKNKDAAFKRLFTSYRRSALLKGVWDSHQIWFVKIVTPDGDNADALSELNQLADELDLPLFVYGEPHVQLVGGLLLHDDPLRYAFDEQPAIELAGLWESELHIEHQVWDTNQVTLLEVSTFTIPPQMCNTTHLLGYTSSITADAWHKLLLNGRDATQWTTVAVQASHSTAELKATLNVQLDDETVVTRISSSDLPKSTLAITAWPYAELQLCGYGEGKQVVQRLRLDETGSLNIAFKETILVTLVDQAFTMGVRWHSMPISEPIECYAPRSVNPNAILFEHCGDMLNIVADIRQWSSNVTSRIRAVAIGSQPWAGQIWQATAPIKRDGWLNACIQVNNNSVHWLLLFQERGNQQPIFLGFHSLSDQQNPQTGANTQDGRTRSQWYTLIKLLEGHDLPYQLQRMIDRARFDRFWQEIQTNYLRIWGWRELRSPALIELVQEFQDAGIQIPQAVCEWIPATETRNLHAIVLAIHDLVHFNQTLDQLHQPVALEIRYPNGTIQRIDACVQWELDDGEHKLRLCAPEKIAICPECRLVLNQHTGHPHWTQPHTQCSPNLRRATKQQRVYVAVLLDIWDILHSFIKSISAMLNERTVAPLWERWLDELHPDYAASGHPDKRAWLEGFQRACVIILTSEGTQLDANDRALVMRYQAPLRTMLQGAKAIVDVDTA